MRKVHQTKKLGVTIIESVEWEEEIIEKEGEKKIVPPSPVPKRRVKTDNRSNVHQKSSQNAKKTLEVQNITESKPINWIVVSVCFISIAVLFVISVNYLHTYDPNLELVLREEADQMTIVSLSIMLIALLFGIAAFFH